MQTSVINDKNLERTFRIDAEFYQTKYLEIEKILSGLKNLKPVTEVARVSDGNHMSIADYFDTEGIPYYRGKDITDFFLENNLPAYIPKAIFNTPLMRRSHFSPGDVLVSIVGTIGSLSIVPEEMKDATGSCKIAILRPRNIDTSYLAMFLMSKYGNEQIKRHVRGTVQTGLILEDFSQIYVMKASDSLQALVKKCVLKSLEYNRESKSLCNQSEQVLLSELGLINWKPKHQLSFVKRFSDAKSADRIDADYFQPMHDELIETVKQYKNGYKQLDNLVSIKKCIEPGSDAYQEDGIPFLRVSNLSKFGINNDNQQYISGQLYEKLKAYQPKKGEILLSKDATPGIAYYLSNEPDNMIPSGGILRLKVKDTNGLNPEYLTLVLNSVVVHKQIERDIGGSVINHWLVDRVKKTLIPVLPDSIQKEISDIIADSFHKREQSKKLLDIAKRGVELAIEKSEKEAEKWLSEEVEERCQITM